MDAKEIKSFAALAEESSKTEKLCGLLFDVAVRDPATEIQPQFSVMIWGVLTVGLAGPIPLNRSCPSSRAAAAAAATVTRKPQH